RPKLEGRELAHVVPEPVLPEEDGTRTVELDANRDPREERSSDNESDRGSDDIDRALEEQRGPRDAGRRESDERKPLEHVDLVARADEFEESRDDVDLNLVVVECADEREGVITRLVGEGHDHPLYVERADDCFERA